MPELRRSSHKLKVNETFVPPSTLRQRGTDKRISKKHKKETKQRLPHGNILGEREIRTATRQRAAPLIAKVNEKQVQVCLLAFSLNHAC